MVNVLFLNEPEITNSSDYSFFSTVEYGVSALHFVSISENVNLNSHMKLAFLSLGGVNEFVCCSDIY